MENFVRTRGSNNNENAEKEYTSITYKLSKPLTSTKIHKKIEEPVQKHLVENDSKDTHTNRKRKHEKTKEELEMKRYRYDVIKFGMSGLNRQTAQQAKISLAISLGAKPPKNKRKNYKKLIEERKKEKIQQTKKNKFASGFNPSQLLMKYKKNNRTNVQKKQKINKKSNGILNVYGKVTKKNGENKKVKSTKNKNK